MFIPSSRGPQKPPTGNSLFYFPFPEQLWKPRMEDDMDRMSLGPSRNTQLGFDFMRNKTLLC